MREELKKIWQCVDTVRVGARHEKDKHIQFDRDLDQAKRRLRVLEELWSAEDGTHRGQPNRKSMQGSQREGFARDGSTLSKSKRTDSPEKVSRSEAAA